MSSRWGDADVVRCQASIGKGTLRYNDNMWRARETIQKSRSVSFRTAATARAARVAHR